MFKLNNVVAGASSALMTYLTTTNELFCTERCTRS